MKKGKEFNDILNECLERLLVKGETIEQCLASYPDQAAELEPLLQTALATKEATAILPSPEFRARARYQFRSALQATEPKRKLSLFGWRPQWVTVAAIVLALLLAGGGTVAAAGNSMPDTPLYPVKLAMEQVRLTLTPSALGKAELYARLADKRVAEIIQMVNKSDPRWVEQTAQRLDRHLAQIASLVLAQGEEGGRLMVPAPLPVPEKGGEADEGARSQVNGRAQLRMTLSRYAVNHPAALRAMLEKAPESVRPALRRAITVSVAGYERALRAAGD